jgi:hypothetical protein
MKNQIPETTQLPYRNKFNGYRCTHRNRWLLIGHNTISIQSLVLLEFYIDISDFDHKHTTFGTFKVNFSKIATLFNCSQNTIRNWHNALIDLNLIHSTEEKQIFKLQNPERYIAPGVWKGQASGYAKEEKNQSVESVLQYMSQDIQLNEKSVQSVVRNNTHYPDNKAIKALGLSKYPSKVVTSNEGFSDDDREWLDKNIKLS